MSDQELNSALGDLDLNLKLRVKNLLELAKETWDQYTFEDLQENQKNIHTYSASIELIFFDSNLTKIENQFFGYLAGHNTAVFTYRLPEVYNWPINGNILVIHSSLDSSLIFAGKVKDLKFEDLNFDNLEPKVLKCECGAEICNTTHFLWCAKHGT